MDFQDLRSAIFKRKHILGITGTTLILLFLVASLDTIDQPNKVDRIEKQTGGGNLGSHTFYHVYLENGSKITYDKYESGHPLCPEVPEKCGEDSQDPGFASVKNLIESSQFKKKDSIFKPQEEICMDSRLVFTEC